MFASRSLPSAEFAVLSLAGTELLADLSGALLWPAFSLAVVADLHLEKASAFAASGRLLPPYDTRSTVARLAAVIERVRPERVVCLGDSFHDGGGAARLGGEDLGRLAALMAGREWIWVAGNHDPEPPAALGGRTERGELRLGPLVFRHQAMRGGTAEISGHFHPKASISTRAGRVSGRCFIADADRLILPAFGALAGGLDTRDAAIAGLFPGDFELHVIGGRRIVTLPFRRAA